jgi:tRNA A-37 threonylcarbamoyl transferase component Bud32
MKQRADKGDAGAQNRYGLRLYKGEGVTKDLRESARYFKMSADQGNAKGQNNYGDCLYKGEGVTKDLRESARYLKMSADQVNADGQNNYGLCLLEGEGVSQDLRESARYFKMSADQGNGYGIEMYDKCMKEASICPSELIIDLSTLKFVREIGRGGFGVVDLMEDQERKEHYAVKYLDVDHGIDSEQIAREVKVLIALNHPCILRIIGWSLPVTECRQARIATEFMSHGSIGDALEGVKNGRIPSFWTHENISIMIVGLLLGLKYMHSQNIIHRDIKPANILLDDEYRIRIGDFGTARFDTSKSTSFVGTIMYMAPEIMSGYHPTKKVDVFGFGLVLYEILVGSSVFPGGNLLETSVMQSEGRRPSIPAWIHPIVRDIITASWSKDPTSRPTFEEIYVRLNESWFPFYRDVNTDKIMEYIGKVEKQKRRRKRK